jgi:ABC-type multidrug transport system fused ATPase/permease subunit
MSSSAIRAGAAYIELTLRDRVSKPLHNASVALKDFGNAVAWQGAKIAAMGAAITAPLAAMAHSFASSALETGRFATKRDAAAVFNYVNALQQLGNAFGELRNAVGSAVLPLMASWPNSLARIVAQSAAWVRQNRGLVQSIARIGTALVVAGTVIGFVGKGLAGLGGVLGVLAGIASTVATAVGMLGSAVAILLTPMGLVIGAAVALGTVIFQQTGLAAQGIQWLQNTFAELHDEALKTWKGIGDAIATGDIKLAAEILWLHIKMEWQKGVNFVNQLWISAKAFFVNLWSDAVFGVAMLFTDAWATVESAWTETVAFMQQGWLTFTSFLSKNLNWAVGEMEKLWVKFRKWLGEDIDVNARVKEIDDTTKRAGEILDQQTTDKKAQTEKRRQDRRKEIESTRRGTQDALGADLVTDQERRQDAFDRERKASEQSLAIAKNDLTKAREKAATQRAVWEKRNPPPPDLPVVLGNEQQKLESKGSFNALAVRGLGADSVAERTAKGVERGAELLKNIDNQIRKGQAVFV